MRLRNKKTGEIRECVVIPIDGNGYPTEYEVFENGNSLAELNSEYEDYEEPKDWWYLDVDGEVCESHDTDDMTKDMKSIGNYFVSREEAEKAVEKLKAWKRLKDKGFKVDLWDYNGSNEQEIITTGRILFRVKDYEENSKDLELIFGGEE